MKQELPTSAREALARQAAAEAHPSADLLSAFIEQALPATENERVTAHLAACLACREIVFLAGAAAGPEPAPTPAPARAQPRRSTWTIWKWAAPALAVIILAAGLFVERSPHRSAARLPAATSTVARNMPAPPLPDAKTAADELKAKPAQPAAPPYKQLPAQAKKTANQQQVPRRTNSVSLPAVSASAEDRNRLVLAPLAPPPASSVAIKGEPGEAASPAPAAPAAKPEAPANEVAMQRSLDTTTGAMGKTAPPATAKAATSRKDGTGGAAGGPFGSAGLALARRDSPAVRWRITDDGHLERSAAPGEWTRVLAEHPVPFHSVTVIGSDVWAGGTGGALFHSTDGGEHWTQVALAAGDQTEHGTLNSIRFNTTLQGTVIADSGATWSTSDGGKTWARH